MSTPRFIRLKELMGITGLSKSNIYTQMRTGAFPSSRKLGPRAIGWLSTEIELWMETESAKETSIQFLFKTGNMKWQQSTSFTLEDLYWEIDTAGYDPFNVPILFMTSGHPMHFEGSALKNSDRGPLRLLAI
ncbi:helix-turn-helix transcriptional regulator [Paludibacterium denitrificans]|uniref:AlpA family phage regulatory protein n=1 Tax=Paludibacterium denitrificans TaxID=2675226 RepID=A0A844GFR6_9NEIS|nr:AlpA family phage regulatory protein [Paludibacterium denitrificans]